MRIELEVARDCRLPGIGLQPARMPRTAQPVSHRRRIEARIDFRNSTALSGERMLLFFREMLSGWRVSEVAIRVRYSRGADFSGACYYGTRRIFINIGEHVTFPYTMRTNLARAQSARNHWWREVYTIELRDAYGLVYFIFLHELYHLLVKVARRNTRQKEGMCDRFAARVLVDRFGCRVVNQEGIVVPRDAWDFQDLDRFVAAARVPTGFHAPIRKAAAVFLPSAMITPQERSEAQLSLFA